MKSIEISRFIQQLGIIYQSKQPSAAISRGSISNDITSLGRTGIILACLFCYISAGNAYNLRQINNKNGLSNSSIVSLGQDENHLMLFGTCDGLNIFDGKNIRIFRSAPSAQTIKGNIIEKIITTSSNTYWVKTNSGLNRLNYQNGEALLFPEFAGYNFIFTNQQNSLFVYDKAGNLHLFNEQTKRFEAILFRKSESIAFQDILDIKFDSNNRLWIYVKNDFCYCFSLHGENTNQPYIDLHEKKRLKNKITHAFPNGDDECVIDENNNLHVINSEHPQMNYIENIGRLTDLKGDISSIVKYKEDFFVGFLTGGAVKLTYTPNGEKPYTITDLGIHCSVFCMMKDKLQDIMWIGTDGQGIYRYTEEEYTLNSYLFSQISPKIQKPVRAILKDKYNNLWVGTRGDGITLFPSFPNAKEQPVHFTSSNSPLNENSVYALAPSSRDILWIGNDGGLNYYSYENKQIQKIAAPPQAESINYIHSLCETNDSTLWAATGGTGVLKITLDPRKVIPAIKSIKRYIHRNTEFIYNYFFSSFHNQNSALFGNRGYGVFIAKDDSLSNVYFNKAPLEQAANDIFCMIQDKEGNLWLGTSLGIVEYTKNKEIRTFKELNEFINSTVQGIQSDADGNLWLSTNRGMVRYNPNAKTYQLYGEEEGVNVIEYCDGASFNDQKEQTLYFGGINGFTTIHKETAKEQYLMFPIVISNLSVLGESVMLSDFLSKEEKGNKLSFNAQQYSFTLKFSVADYIYSSSILLYYRINEIDENWTKIVNNTLNFNNLHPGEYTLEMKYINQAISKESDIYPIQIHVTPPWYASIWAYIVYSSLILACIFLIVWSVLHRNRLKKKRELKELEQAHQKEVYESKLDFFTNVAYEFSTPLTLIFGPCNRIIRQCPDKNSVKYATVIQRNAEILNDLTQEIVTFRNIESKERKPYIEQLPVGEIISKDIITFVDQAYSNQILFEKEIDPALTWNSDRFFLRTIIINLLSDAFQHTNENGKISIQMATQEKNLTITISYTGEITEKEIRIITDQHHILDKFKNINDTKFLRNELRLTISHNMVSLLQGKLLVDKDEQKVRFTIKLPALEPDIQQMKIFDIDPIRPAYLKTGNNPDIKEAVSEFNIIRQTLFLIEQNEEMLWFLIDIFHDEFNIIPIGDCAQAMHELKAFQPDLIIYDIAGNITNGIQLTEQLKNNKNYAHIPIILLSGERNMEEQIKGINAGAEMYIFKPFHSDYLKISVNQLLNRKETLKNYFNSPKSAYDLSNAKLVHKEDKKFIEEILNIINTNLTNKELSANLIANQLNISIRHLYRKLNEIGETKSIANMIKDCRLQVAKDLLINTKYSIDEIAYKSGFQARSSFFRCFTDKFHITPKEFRKQQE